MIPKELEAAFCDRFDSNRSEGHPSGGAFYSIRIETQEIRDYETAEREAAETLSDEEMKAWYDSHEMPDYEEYVRFIPDDEDLGIVENLMRESLKQGKDLLWERYKDNIPPPEPEEGAIY